MAEELTIENQSQRSKQIKGGISVAFIVITQVSKVNQKVKNNYVRRPT